jgi:di/tricarboxylate transporter
MTLQQSFAFAIIAGMMALFVWGRIRYDLVALLTLLAAVCAGIVPYDKAFSGFSDDIIVIVASALLVSAAVARSGVIERILRRYGSHLKSTGTQVIALTAIVAMLSAFVKNIGALAMLMPVAFQLARRNNKPVSALLMPMSFAALLGGIVTLVGTSPNIIVSRVREEIVGQPFRMFDFAPVGAGIAIIGLIFLAFGWRLLPRGRKGAATMDAAFNIEGYTTEAAIPDDSPIVGKTVGALVEAGENEIEVVSLMRGRDRRYDPNGNMVLKAGDIVILQGEPSALERVVGLENLKLTRDGKSHALDSPSDEIGVLEAVVTAESPLIDRTPVHARLHESHAVNLLAVSRAGRRITQRLRAVKLSAGDVIVLQGNLATMPETLGTLRLLPLAERELAIGRGRRSLLPIIVLAAAMLLVALRQGTDRDCVLRRCNGPAIVAFADAARGVRRHRMADPCHAWRADPGERRVANHRRHRPDRGLACRWWRNTCRRWVRWRSLWWRRWRLRHSSTMPRPCWWWRRSRLASPRVWAIARTRS